MHKSVKHLSIPPLLLMAAIACSAASTRVHGATTHHALSAIRDAARDFALQTHGQGDGMDSDSGEAVKVEPSLLDPRLRLAACDQPLKAFWAPGSRHVGGTTIGVRCDGSRPWKLYLPTRISVQAQVAVTTRPLTRGHRLGPGDLKLATRELSTLRGDAIRDPALVVGYVLTRALGANRPLSPKVLAPPRLVERGRPVRVLVAMEGLTVRMTGIALEDGARGEMVRVRNPGSRRVIHAEVIAAGVVSLTGPRVATR